MTQILSPLLVGFLDNNRYVFLHEPFGFRSDVLASHGLTGLWRPEGLPYAVREGEVWAPSGFVFDFESTPNFIRGPLGENKRGGAGHDLVCRKGVFADDTKITKSIAADVYFEIMAYCDSIDTWRFSKARHPFIPGPVVVPVITFLDWSRRWLKSETVRYWPGDFWQKYTIWATASEIYEMDCDPYITKEQG